MPYTLDNAEQLAAAAPRSFFIPPPHIRHALKPGDTVKLVFRLEREDGDVAVERMWVEVLQTDPYVGTLVNQPHLEGVVAYGDQVTFGPEHVAAYDYPEEDLGYDPAERCFVSKRILEEDTPPALLHLSADLAWEAHAANETPEELEDPDRVLYWSLGYLTDKFPGTEPVLREGAHRGGLLRRRPRDAWWMLEGDRYVRWQP